ncbi:hypothetical protein CEP49_06100 [Mergibacter septicus]|uniref:hypothetical protein n=1 Tax=Mergibacter septicus TaxID=221402 RepID=UPI0011791ED6|nr:hypothetical protein [Mergibacter septicus]AWX14150.1 hypothetical protein CEP49_06100 [Mergibacter septicus]
MLASEFLIKIGVAADEKGKLKNLEANLKNVTKAATLLGAAIGGAFAGITAFVKSSLGELDEIAQLSRVTGESAENIQTLGKVAETNGSSMQAAQASIAGLSKVIGEAANGTGLGAKSFENYGLSARKANGEIKTSTEILEEVRQKMIGMSNQQQIAMLSKLGIDASMIQTLRLTNEEMLEAKKNAEALTLGVGTQENADEAAALQDSLTNVGQIVKSIGQFVALNLSPAVREIVETFKKWFVVNNEIIKKNLRGFAEGLAKTIKFFAGLFSALDRVISSTIGWKNAIYIVGGVLTWLNRKMLVMLATNPLLLMITSVVAGIAGLIALIDDLIVYMKGGKSYFGDAWEPVVKIIYAIQDALKEFEPLFDELSIYFTNIANAIKFSFSGLINALKGIWDIIIGIFTLNGKKISQGFARFFNGIRDYFVGIWAAIKESFNAGLMFVSSVFSGIFDKLKSVFSTTTLSSLFDNFFDIITLPFRLAVTAVKTLWDMLLGNDITADSISNTFNRFTDLIKAPFKAAFDWISEKYNEFIAPIVDKASGFVGKIASWFGSGDSASSVSSTAQIPVSNSTNSNSVRNNNNTVSTNITINGATNPQETANLVSNQAVRAINNPYSLQVN